MRVYCTNPNCPSPEKIWTENLSDINRREKRYCDKCRTDLILENRYLPLEEIGSGGFGKTFRAHDFTFEKECAVKILRPLQQLRPSELKSVERGFQQGARILNTLNHQQIPRVYDYFELEVSRLQTFFYLVQEYIPGQTLAQELANKPQRRFSETEVIEVLRSLLQIITYTHQQNILHRDITPSNIIHHTDNKKLYLIDFDGAIKRQLEPGVPVDQSRAIGTPGYAPPEQLCGRDIDISADLYAIAATCVYLLTGRKPAEICKNSKPLHEEWRIYIPNVEENLAGILDKMLSPFPYQRYRSAREVLDVLSAISTSSTSPDSVRLSRNHGSTSTTPLPSPPSSILQRLRRIPKLWRWISFLGFLALLGMAIALFLYLIRPPIPAEYFSRGEKALIAEPKEASTIPECKTAYDLKKQGMEAFAKARYPADFQKAEDAFFQAKNQFQYALKKSPRDKKCNVDPETWIYYYNSKAAQNASAGSLPTIAVVIPSLEKDRGIAEQILRGVAQVQSEQKEGAPGLQILIAKDDGKQQVAKSISENNIPEKLSYFSNSKILGVVGRYISKKIREPADIYGKKQLVLISPTSTAIRQPSWNQYLFRTASDDSIATKKLAIYVQKNPKWRKVLIIFDSEDKEYSEQFKNTLAGKLGAQYEDDIIGCDLRLRPSDWQSCIAQAKQKNVQVLMLAPSSDTSTQALNTAKDMKLNNQSIQFLAGDVLYNSQTTLDLGGASAGMVLAVFSHVDLAKQKFTDIAKELWKTPEVGWRAMTSYDAAQVFVKALTDLRDKGNNHPTRQDIYDRLNDEKFSAQGATLNIEFDNKHDRKRVTGVGVLVKVKCNTTNADCIFTPLENQNDERIN